jgi:ParB family chromosome partitioning protein
MPLYELVAGERRFRACKMLGMEYISCIIINATEESSAELAIIENLLRKNLNFFEQAQAFSRLSTVFCLTQEEIAAKMSLSQSAVANKLRLLKLTQEEQLIIIKSDLSERHARALLRIANPVERKQVLEYVVINKLNVSQTEKYISELIGGSKQPSQVQAKTSYTPEKICTSIYRYIAKLQKDSKNLIINRKSDDKSITITLTVRKNA